MRGFETWPKQENDHNRRKVQRMADNLHLPLQDQTNTPLQTRKTDSPVEYLSVKTLNISMRLPGQFR